VHEYSFAAFIPPNIFRDLFLLLIEKMLPQQNVLAKQSNSKVWYILGYLIENQRSCVSEMIAMLQNVQSPRSTRGAITQLL